MVGHTENAALDQGVHKLGGCELVTSLRRSTVFTLIQEATEADQGLDDNSAIHDVDVVHSPIGTGEFDPREMLEGHNGPLNIPASKDARAASPRAPKALLTVQLYG